MTRTEIKNKIKDILRNNQGTYDSNVDAIVDFIEDTIRKERQ